VRRKFEMTENILYRELVREFREISRCDSNLESYENYYQAYVKFINEHRDYFTDSFLEEWGLDILISIEIKEYIVPNPDLSLSLEKSRLSKGEYKNIDTGMATLFLTKIIKCKNQMLVI
jgi:hypothetical protein